MYAINKMDGYIVGVVAGVSVANSNATEEQYRAVKAMLLNPPSAPDGYCYRLREDLEWELCEMPPAPEIPEDAGEGDYIAALREMGVSL